uniref:Uncharacterized protein n=1 Tax=Opuntia streptacantha TaxID=393608 RepID=A0A7C8Z7Y5_OPUST
MKEFILMPLQPRRWSSFQSFQIQKCSKCLLAQGIKDQVKKFDKIVAIVAGTHFNHLRRFWNARTLPENKSAVEGLFVRYEDSGVRAPLVKTHKTGPSVLTLAGVTAVLAGSALFKEELITPVYWLMKREWLGHMPWFVYTACTGWLLYGHGILYSRSTACLGRGIQKLQQTSREIRE